MPQGVIYILTNLSFPDYVKNGYATDIEKRLSDIRERIEKTAETVG